MCVIFPFGVNYALLLHGQANQYDSTLAALKDLPGLRYRWHWVTLCTPLARMSKPSL